MGRFVSWEPRRTGDTVRKSIGPTSASVSLPENQFERFAEASFPMPRCQGCLAVGELVALVHWHLWFSRLSACFPLGKLMLSSFRYFTRCYSCHFSFPGNGIPVALEQTGTAARSEAHVGHAGAHSPTEVCLALASEGKVSRPRSLTIFNQRGGLP
jgi:hypothetical protein